MQIIIIEDVNFFGRELLIEQVFRLDNQRNFYRFSYLLTSASRHRCPHASLASGKSSTVPASLSALVPRTVNKLIVPLYFFPITLD